MLHKRSHHFWAGRNLRWRRQLRLEVVRTQALVGKGVGGTLRPLHQQTGCGGGRRRRGGRGRGREGAGLWVLDESSLDRSVVLLLNLLLHHHVEVWAAGGDLDLTPGLLSLLWSVFVVRVLHLVEKSQLLCLRSEGGSLLLTQSLPFLSQVLKRRLVRESSDHMAVVAGGDKELLGSQQLSLRWRIAWITVGRGGEGRFLL